MPQRSHDSASIELEQATLDESPEQWEHLLALLPQQALRQTREQRAFVCACGLRHPGLCLLPRLVSPTRFLDHEH